MEPKSENTVDLPDSSNAEVTARDSDNDGDTVEYPSAFWAACVSVGVALGLFLVLIVLFSHYWQNANVNVVGWVRYGR